MREKYLFIDAETNGLYGEFITVAMIVTDREGMELDRFYQGVKIREKTEYEEWVKENVLPYLGDYKKWETQEELLESVWQFWMKWKEEVYVIADTPYPVEARLFISCVERKKKEREFQAPFPLLDLGSMLWMKKTDPLIRRDCLLKAGREGTIHNALSDVRTMIEIWKDFEEG